MDESRRFLVTSILNNNALLAYDQKRDREVVMYANGIGFSSRKGMMIAKDQAKKIFVVVDDNYKNQLLNMLEEIPFDCIEMTQKIVDLCEQKLNTKLNPSLLVNLADHINFTIKRYSQGLNAPILVVNEIERFYPAEFELGEEAVKMINEHYHINLIKDEAASIAFHIINASGTADNAETRKIMYGVKDIISITEEVFGINFEQNNINYSRYVTHLKYFLKNVLTNNSDTYDTNDILYSLLSRTNASVGECLDKIDDYMNKIFNYHLTKNDRAYLTIHLLRILGNKVKLGG